ncbi:MAG: hypothetical protein JXR82_01140 [Marinifilaceae bacterium]|nr:hypothetical protein [Marinifilaceae bacterium]
MLSFKKQEGICIGKLSNWQSNPKLSLPITPIVFYVAKAYLLISCCQLAKAKLQ